MMILTFSRLGIENSIIVDGLKGFGYGVLSE